MDKQLETLPQKIQVLSPFCHVLRKIFLWFQCLKMRAMPPHPHKLVWSLRTGYGFGQIGLLGTGAGQHPVFYLHFQLLGPVTFTFATSTKFSFSVLRGSERLQRFASKLVTLGTSWEKHLGVKPMSFCGTFAGHFQCRNLMNPQRFLLPASSWLIF